MASPFGIVGFLFSKNLPLLVGVVALDYLGMYFLNLGDIVENIMFFVMVFFGLIFANTVHSGGSLVRLLLILFVCDMLLRGGLYAFLPKEITTATTETIVQHISL